MKEKLKSYKVIIAIISIAIIFVSFVLSLFNVELPLEYIATICSIVLSVLIVFGLVDVDMKDINTSDIKNDILSAVDSLKENMDETADNDDDTKKDDKEV